MNKKQVNDWILPAKQAIIDCGIAENGKVNSAFRGQISSFGAAVVMGSLKSAVAFFADDGKAKVPRSKLILAIYQVITETKAENPEVVFQYICDSRNDNRQTKEKFINASIAIKLALNFFELVTDKADKEEGNGED